MTPPWRLKVWDYGQGSIDCCSEMRTKSVKKETDFEIFFRILLKTMGDFHILEPILSIVIQMGVVGISCSLVLLGYLYKCNTLKRSVGVEFCKWEKWPQRSSRIAQEASSTLWGFLDLKSELIRKGETQNQGKNGQI